MTEENTKNLWRAVLMQAIQDAYGAYTPGKKPLENKLIAERQWYLYEKGEAKRAPHRFSFPDFEAIHARSWFKNGGMDYRTVLSFCGFDPGHFRNTMISEINEIEKLEKYFKKRKSK